MFVERQDARLAPQIAYRQRGPLLPQKSLRRQGLRLERRPPIGFSSDNLTRLRPEERLRPSDASSRQRAEQ
jgi:hypothetical protein